MLSVWKKKNNPPTKIKTTTNLEYKQLTWREDKYEKEVAATLHNKKELGLQHI